MKICVLNGSPKGEVSVTMQYVELLKIKFPEHNFTILHIAHTLPKIEKDMGEFHKVIEEIKASDAVLWAFPLYVCMVHGNYKRFIELVFERDAKDVFKDKYTAALSTSIHFFDNTAHRYLEAVCNDLYMHYTGYFSAAMDDIMKDENRQKLKLFTEDFIEHAEKKLPVPKAFYPVEYEGKTYAAGEAFEKTDNTGLKVLLISDIPEDRGNLRAMSERFKNAFNRPVEHIDINNIRINGGCLGCLHCGYDNHCVYGEKDDIYDVYNKKIHEADIIVFALHIRDRFFSARFKTFIDRRFLNTHQPQMTGKQIGFIVSGPLSRTPNITDICQAITELDQANLCGIVTDESVEETDCLIDTMAKKLVKMAKEKYIKPQTFLGIGGTRIFRDEIFSNLRFVFRADHKYYKKHGLYDFPQKKVGRRISSVLMMLMQKIPGFRKYVQKNMKTLMLTSYKKAISTKG